MTNPRKKKARRQSPPPSYAAKIKFIRQFMPVKKGKLTPGKKAAITRAYKKLSRAARGARHYKADAATREKFRNSGAVVTEKGIFIPIEKGMKTRITKKGIAISTGGNRTEYFIPLSPAEAAAVIGDPRAAIPVIVNDRLPAHVKKKHAGEKYYIRLVFSRSQSKQDYKADRLQHYLEEIPDLLDKDGRVRKSRAQRLAAISKSMTGIKVVFVGQKSKSGEMEWAN